MSSSTPAPLTIAAFQQVIKDRYYEADVARGTERTWLCLSEEFGELARALLKKNDRANLEEEFADVIAWLCTLANINDVDLAAVIAKKYLGTNVPTGIK
jgi:NTP pyrophosphatase (non-canonical NTP hydrolase)